MATRERTAIPARLRKAGIASAGDNVGKGQRVAAPARLITQTFKRELMGRLRERGGTHGEAEVKYTLIDAPVTRWSNRLTAYDTEAR